MVKYQKKLENYFTIVHYDRRGSGKSYQRKEDYSDLTVPKFMEDLKCIITYVCEELAKDKIILAGHSFGTEIALRTAAVFPDKIMAYVGIGQMTYTALSEKEGLSTAQRLYGTAEGETAEAVRELQMPCCFLQGGGMII